MLLHFSQSFRILGAPQHLWGLVSKQEFPCIEYIVFLCRLHLFQYCWSAMHTMLIALTDNVNC